MYSKTLHLSSQLLRTIGATYYKGADIGECLSTAYRIKEGDFESWHMEWLKTANRVHEYAEDCLAKGHKVSAREAYLRASNYWGSANSKYLANSKECFGKAANLFSFAIESIEIPYEGTALPGYFYRAGDHNNGKSGYTSRPTIIAHGGFDSTSEELIVLHWWE